MILHGSTCSVRVFGWHCKRLARRLDANGKSLGESQAEIDRVITDAMVLLFAGKGCVVVDGGK